MTYDPGMLPLWIDHEHDEAWSALPTAPVVMTAPATHTVRRRTAALLRRIADGVDGVSYGAQSPTTN